MLQLGDSLQQNNLVDIKVSKKLHVQMITSKCDIDASLGISLVTLMQNVSTLTRGVECFLDWISLDLVSQTSMISRYAQNCDENEPIGLFYQLQSIGKNSNQFICSGVLQACANLILDPTK